MKEAADLYSALNMKPTAYFTPPDDGLKVRCALVRLMRDGHVSAAEHVDHRWTIALQYIQQFKIALSSFKVSAPTDQRDCPSMP